MGKSLISKYLIITIIILAVGVPAAYAITITLGGDPVIINGILDLMGNRITNVGTPTTTTDAATKGYVDSIVISGTPGVIDADTLDGIDSTGFSQGPHTVDTDTLAGLSCAANEIPKFVGSTWICAVDVDTDTTFDGTDFAVSNQACSVGQKVTGVDASGSVTCAVDIDTVPWNSRVPQSTSLFAADSSAGIVGKDTSITIGTDGLPVISYIDDSSDDLKVVHCTNISCSTSDIPTTVDFVGIVGIDTSITIGTDGLPVISYFDQTNGDLKVAHCTNISCSTSTTATVDFVGTVGAETSITIGTDGLPVISYFDDTDNDLKVVHCLNVSCSGGVNVGFDPPTAVDTLGIVGTQTSITIGTDGLPVISYHGSSPNFDLKVAHCSNISCSSGSPTITTLDSAGFVGLDTSITIGTDGLPVISYRDVTNNNLKVVHCLNVSCSGGEGIGFDTPTVVDSAGDVGIDTSITIGTDGLPVISYFDSTNGDLKVAHCTNTSCSTFDTPTTVDSAGFVGIDTSITIGTDGLPVISYHDSTNGDLKVAKCTNPICLNNWIRR